MQGQPYEKRYKINSQKYLGFEKQAIKNFLFYINALTSDEKIVIDTTGSLIYLDKAIISALKKFTTIVYLNTPTLIQKQMCQKYFKNPKPVIWGNSFKQKKGQSQLEALIECYPKLLSFRSKRYKKYADITIDYSLLKSKNFAVKKFINLISTQL
ncbi:MAG: hypothetical protein ABH808_02070 [Candidatus Kuenenbacteria bacterium]